MKPLDFDKILKYGKHVRVTYPENITNTPLLGGATLAEITKAYAQHFKEQSEELECLVS